MLKERFAASLESVELALAFARSAAPAWVSVEGIDLGLTEIVVNAIVHGSSGAEPDAPDARIELAIEATEDACRFTVEWSRNACPEDSRAGRDVDVLETSGRGLLIAEAFFDRLEWRADGLAVTGEFTRAGASS